MELLTDTQTPSLPPPSTPTDSDLGSFVDYSPITPSIAKTETYTTKSICEDSVTGRDSKTNDSTVDLIDLTNSKSLSSIKTFSSDEDETFNPAVSTNVGSLHDDSVLFEKYNGSSSDLVTKNGNATPDHNSVVVNNLDTMSLKIEKIRQGEPAEPQFDDSVVKKFKDTSRKVTPVLNPVKSVSEISISNRIAGLEKQIIELEIKITKLNREIVYVEKMIQDIEFSSHLNQSNKIELQKLYYAKGKLEERLMAAKKDKYMVGVTLSKLRRNLFGDNSGDMTDYFARKVSH